MGYRTYYSLTVYKLNGKEVSEEELMKHEKAIPQIIDPFYTEMNAENFWGMDESWNDIDEDMIGYSKLYSDLVFEIHGIGDETEDMWYAYYHNGQEQTSHAQITYEPCKFFKNENEKVQRTN